MTEGGELTAVPAVADWLVALFAASVAAAPAVAVALKVTGDPAPVACTVCVPAVVPSVQVVVAMPLPLLVDVVGLTDPLPVAGVHVTETPPTGLLNRSATRTESCVGKVVPTVPVCPSPPAGVICDAPAAVALILNVTVVSVPAIVAVAVVVCVPINIPSVRNVCACPFASVVEVAGSTDPPPDAAAHVTVTPVTGFPFGSLTSTTCGVCRRVATCPVRLSPELLAMVADGPAVPVAVNVTGLPASDPDVAVNVLAPAVALSVQLPTAATPLALVLWLAPVIVPFPGATANVTATCATGFPFASFTITDGGVLTAVPAVADWLVGLFAAIAAAAPAVPVAVKVTGLPVSDPDVAVRVLLPAVALSVQLPTVATPLAFVVWLPPVTVPFPGATAKVTATPPTAFPFASLTITDGGEATAVPAPAV